MTGDAPPSVSGTLASGLREVVQELAGPECVERALRMLPTQQRSRFETFTAVEWVPIDTMEAAFSAIATEMGTSVGVLHERVAVISIERTLRTVWRVLLRVTTDRALVHRTPVLFSRGYNRGRLIAEIPSKGRGEIALLDWPNAPPWPLRATRIGVATVLRVAGRKDVSVTVSPTATGAEYIATWR